MKINKVLNKTGKSPYRISPLGTWIIEEESDIKLYNYINQDKDKKELHKTEEELFKEVSRTLKKINKNVE